MAKQVLLVDVVAGQTNCLAGSSFDTVLQAREVADITAAGGVFVDESLFTPAFLALARQNRARGGAQQVLIAQLLAKLVQSTQDGANPLRASSVKTPTLTTTTVAEGGDGTFTLDLERGAGTGLDAGRAHLAGNVKVKVHQQNNAALGFTVALEGQSGQQLALLQMISATASPPVEDYFAWNNAWNLIGVKHQMVGGNFVVEMFNANNFGVDLRTSVSSQCSVLASTPTEFAFNITKDGRVAFGSPAVSGQGKALLVPEELAANVTANPPVGFALVWVEQATGVWTVKRHT